MHFSSNRGSFETLNVSTFHGRSSWSRQVRATVSFPTPRYFASDRVVQWVDVSGGRSC